MNYHDALTRLAKLKGVELSAASIVEPAGALTKPTKLGSVSFGSTPPGHAKNQDEGFVSFVSATRPGSPDLKLPQVELGVGVRRAWSDALCRAASAQVARDTPKGLGHWPGAWERVEAPSKALLDRLADWERTGSGEDRAGAEHAATQVLAAWRAAAAEWAAPRPLGEPCPGCGEACEACLP